MFQGSRIVEGHKEAIECTLVLPTLSSKHLIEKSVNRQALLKILSNENTFLNDWMKQNGDKYTSKDIQNEMMKVIALQVLREIAAEICSPDFFTIMVYEATDVATISQLTLCIRWVNNTWIVTRISSDSIHLALSTWIPLWQLSRMLSS